MATGSLIETAYAVEPPPRAKEDALAWLGLDVLEPLTPGAPVAPAPEPQIPDDDRRSHPRMGPNDLWWLRDTRVKYGNKVKILDLSIGGALIETDSRMDPGVPFLLELRGPGAPLIVPARTIRSTIVSLDGKMRYRAACEFKRPLDLPNLLPSTSTEKATTSGRLDLALKSLVAERLHTDQLTQSGKASPADLEWTLELLKRLRARAKTHEDVAIVGPVDRMLEEAMALLQHRATWNEIRSGLGKGLRKQLPGLTIGISQAPLPSHDRREETVYFALERVPSMPEYFLNVQIPSTFRLEHSHFRLMKAAASIASLLQFYSDAGPVDRPVDHREVKETPQAERSGLWRGLAAAGVVMAAAKSL